LFPEVGLAGFVFGVGLDLSDAAHGACGGTVGTGCDGDFGVGERRQVSSG
jgi:hypothetical protein